MNPTPPSPDVRYQTALNKVAKIRTLLTGWQLGTRPKGDPEGDAVRDHREQSLLLRVEMTAVVALLIEKGVFTLDEFYGKVADEADQAVLDYQDKFPGVTITDHGLTMDPSRIAAWMKTWKP
jgi:hypothetical protein